MTAVGLSPPPQWTHIGEQFDGAAQAYERNDNKRAREFNKIAVTLFKSMPEEQRLEISQYAGLFQACYCVRYGDASGKIGCQILSKSIQVYSNREIPRPAEVDKWRQIAEHLRKANLATAEAMMKSLPQEQQNLVIQNTLALGRSDPVLNNPLMQEISEISVDDDLRYRYMAAAIETYLKLTMSAFVLPLSAPVESAKNTIKRWYRKWKGIKDRAETCKYEKLIRVKQEPLFRVERIFSASKRAELIATVEKLISSIKFPEMHPLFKNEYAQMKSINRARWQQMLDALKRNLRPLPIAVWDQHNELQAMALIFHASDWFEIIAFATAPTNLGGNGRYRGAGTAAVESALRLAERWQQKSVFIMKDTTAIPFYNKIGLVDNTTPAAKFEGIFRAHGGKARPVFTHLA